ncbi:MAG: hypothetical protein JW863_10350 [Chitinispirillaceae bacterium]|nr:hypothetical protein [Chitinispirillaceae bacterium]
MNADIIKQLIVFKLDMSDRVIGMLPERHRKQAAAIRRMLLPSVKEATEQFLREQPEEKESGKECSAIPID